MSVHQTAYAKASVMIPKGDGQAPPTPVMNSDVADNNQEVSKSAGPESLVGRDRAIARVEKTSGKICWIQTSHDWFYA